MNTVQLRRLAEVNPSTAEFDSIADDELITFMPLEACWPDGRADTTRRVVKKSVSTGYSRFRDGDVLLPKITPTFEAGRVFPAQGGTSVGAATTEVHVLRAKGTADVRFLAYVARSLPFLTEGAASLQGVGNLRRVSTEWVRAFDVPDFELAEQGAIADYLDRETAQIDTLIAKQEQLIATLRERRRALVTHALAKSTAGHVPLRRIGHTTAGSGFPITLQGQTDNEIPFFKVKHLGLANDQGELGRADDTITAETAKSLGATVFPAGTFVYAKVGAALLLGRICTLREPACLDNNLAGLVPNDEADRRFLRWAMTLVRFDFLVNPGAVPSLSDKNLLSYRLPVPPRAEQVAIATYLDEQTSKIDLLISKAEQFIALSRERRAALITAAVTGQLDVTERAA